MTKNKKYLKQWVQPDEFMARILGYKEVQKDKFIFGDIVVFYDENQNIQHACFALNNDLFINKNGQLKFNPIQVLDFHDIKQSWKEFNYKTFRDMKNKEI